MTFDAAPGYLSADDCRLADLIDLVPFPTHLDLDQPVDGLAPHTQADILGRAVSERWSRQQLETELGTWGARRQTRRYTYSTKEIR